MRKPLASFFLLTFAVTWTLQFSAVLLGVPITSPPAMALLILAGITPSAVAVLLTAREGGRQAVKALWGPAGSSRASAGWILVAFCLRNVLIGIAAVLGVVVGAGSPLIVFTPLMIGAAIIAPLGEEFGWRVFAYTRLASRVGRLHASVIISALWAVWHVPTAFYPGAGGDIAGFALFLVQVAAIGVVICWVFERAQRRAIIAVIAHVGVNLAVIQLPDAWLATAIETGVLILAAVLAGRALARSSSAQAGPQDDAHGTNSTAPRSIDANTPLALSR